MTITIASVEAAAHAATLGFHFLWIEMEHSPITLETLRLMVLATRGLPAAVFARVPVVELWTAKRVLDQGVSGVIFPFAGTAEKAARAAAACRYPPAGKRGSGAGAAVRTWPVPGNYYDSADREVFTICVVEEASALDRDRRHRRHSRSGRALHRHQRSLVLAGPARQAGRAGTGQRDRAHCRGGAPSREVPGQAGGDSRTGSHASWNRASCCFKCPPKSD